MWVARSVVVPSTTRMRTSSGCPRFSKKCKRAENDLDALSARNLLPFALMARGRSTSPKIVPIEAMSFLESSRFPVTVFTLLLVSVETRQSATGHVRNVRELPSLKEASDRYPYRERLLAAEETTL